MDLVLETERLLLRPMRPEDAEAAFGWCGDPEVNRFMMYPLYTSVEAVRTWIEGLEGYEFALERKTDGVVIGSCGFRWDKGTQVWTFGYNLIRSEWNKGYATEATRRMLDYIHDELGGHDFLAEHAVENPASGRVMEKCGMTFDRYGEYQKSDGSESFPAKYYKLHWD